MEKKYLILVILSSLTLITIGCASMKETVMKMYENIEVKNVEKITEKDIEHLPEVVQNYLRHTNIIGKEKIKAVRLKQGGDFRLKPDENFRTMTAEQYFNIDSMEFYWKGNVSIITAIDKFINGDGSMVVKLFGLFKVAEMNCPEVNQGEMIRFLAEGVWFPSMFVNDYITWESLRHNAAKATIKYADISATVVFYFNEKYEVEKIAAKRYMEKDGTFLLKDWEIQILSYKKFNDVLIPNKSKVIWKLADGDFCWYKPEIFEIEYNKPFLYE